MRFSTSTHSQGDYTSPGTGTHPQAPGGSSASARQPIYAWATSPVYRQRPMGHRRTAPRARWTAAPTSQRTAADVALRQPKEPLRRRRRLYTSSFLLTARRTAFIMFAFCGTQGPSAADGKATSGISSSERGHVIVAAHRFAREDRPYNCCCPRLPAPHPPHPHTTPSRRTCGNAAASSVAAYGIGTSTP